jgi:hypothetical protein
LKTSYITAETSLYTLTALYPLNLLGINKINISLQILNTNNFSSVNGNTSFIEGISENKPPLRFISFRNTGSVKLALTKADVHKIDLTLYEEDFNYLNFCNINWLIIFC